MAPLVRSTSCGLYCEAGDFYIDPWKSVEKAILTHAHSDHARQGSKHYLATHSSLEVLRERLGSDAHIQTLPFGQSITEKDVTISFHPAGHILGSAQIRLEHKGEVWVITGDFKLEPDATCETFEPLRCHTLITESTFALPIYHWKPQRQIFEEIDEWRTEGAEKGKTCVLFSYPLGKSQRLLAGVNPNRGPIVLHGAVDRMTNAYRRAGIVMPATYHRDDVDLTREKAVLVIAPPSVEGTTWLRTFGSISTGFASGWMQIRGTRRRRSLDRGFALSDHADWPSLLATIESSGAERVLVTHGYTTTLVRYLRERGIEADTIATHFEAAEELLEHEEAEPRQEDDQQ